MKQHIFETAEILSVGTELLIGDIVNTDAAFLAKHLAALGINVYHQSVVGDNPERLAEDIRTALSRADLLIMSGGLGPTMDDLTKETAAAVFGRKMELHEPSLSRMEHYFAATHRVMTENNRKQAMMPEGAIVFPNDYGTAPALAMENEKGQAAILLPGPPRELEPLFLEQVEPYLKQHCHSLLYNRNLHIIGMGESSVENALPRDILESTSPTVAMYCAPGEVRIRLTAKCQNEEEGAALCDSMEARIRKTAVAPFIYGVDVPSPEVALVKALAKKNLTVATAESCTGGLIAKRLTDVAGSSAVVAGGAVTYQTREKEILLGVPHSLIETYTVVSREVALAMAKGARETMKTDMAIATTGYAGPTGGTEKDPVGTVYIAVSTKKEAECVRLSLSPFRERTYIREVAATTALRNALHLIYKK